MPDNNTEVKLVTLELLRGRDNVSPAIHIKKQVGTLLFEGDFKFHRPDCEGELAAEAAAARWLTGSNGLPLAVTDFNDMYVHAVSTLPYVLHEHPDWFDLKLLREREVINEVYLSFLEWDRSFRGAVQETPQGGSKE
jgi:hypothetical protein